MTHLGMQVCGGLGRDMWEVLEPLRAARPVNGGNPADLELVHQQRLLNYQLK